jgi:hypothetical protein
LAYNICIMSAISTTTPTKETPEVETTRPYSEITLLEKVKYVGSSYLAKMPLPAKYQISPSVKGWNPEGIIAQNKRDLGKTLLAIRIGLFLAIAGLGALSIFVIPHLAVGLIAVTLLQTIVGLLTPLLMLGYNLILLKTPPFEMPSYQEALKAHFEKNANATGTVQGANLAIGRQEYKAQKPKGTP